jgi:putative oxidoreductase
MIAKLLSAYRSFVALLNHLQSPLLLAIRLYWGFQFMQDGYGKLTHLEKVAGFFATLNLPAPGATAMMVGSVELIGGALFFAGIASRLVSLVLFLNISHFFSNPSDFYGATPYTYWFAALLILILGPGLFAIDTLISRRLSEAGN